MVRIWGDQESSYNKYKSVSKIKILLVCISLQSPKEPPGLGLWYVSNRSWIFGRIKYVTLTLHAAVWIFYRINQLAIWNSSILFDQIKLVILLSRSIHHRLRYGLLSAKTPTVPSWGCSTPQPKGNIVTMHRWHAMPGSFKFSGFA